MGVGVGRWVTPADGTEEVESSGSKALPSPGSVSRKRQEPSNRARKTNSRLSFWWVPVPIVISLSPITVTGKSYSFYPRASRVASLGNNSARHAYAHLPQRTACGVGSHFLLAALHRVILRS